MMIWTSNQGWLSYCTDPDYPDFRQQAPTLLVNMNPPYRLTVVKVSWTQNEKYQLSTYNFLGLSSSPYETSTVSLSVSLSVISHHQIFQIFLHEVSLH